MTVACDHCIFDAYGTLFDVAAATRNLAASEPLLSDTWGRLADVWRTKQLEYTWLRAIMGDHADFAQVTAEALDWALEDCALPARLHAPLIALYQRLDAYPEVRDMLSRLQARGVTCAILSNGAPEMLADAVRSAGLGSHLSAVLSVEQVRVFKPDARVYAMACTQLGILPGQALFVSSNGWDAAGAARFGFVTAWVNRAGKPVDRLPHRPDHVLKDLTSIPDLMSAR